MKLAKNNFVFGGRRYAVFIMLTILIGAAFNSCKQKSNSDLTPQTAIHAVQYHCPMHPTYVSDKPGTCPICGMTLVLMEENQNQGEDGEKSQSLPDRSPIELTADREQMIGVRTVVVEKKNLSKIIRASAKVAFDPDLYNALVEYKEGLQALESAQESTFKDVQMRAGGVLESARLRLKLLGLSEKQAKNLLARAPQPTALLLPEQGDHAWVYAQIYEYESPFVKIGQIIEITSPAFPGKTFQGTVFSVDSVLNPESRSLRVRADVKNPGGFLKPEMFADAVIKSDLGIKLVIPKEAVLNTGTRRLVFVKTGPGRYEPREVKIGAEGDDNVEITEGLKEKEEVVSSANFLIDSESKLKAALQGAGK